jgi:hypothetical protein
MSLTLTFFKEGMAVGVHNNCNKTLVQLIPALNSSRESLYPLTADDSDTIVEGSYILMMPTTNGRTAMVVVSPPGDESLQDIKYMLGSEEIADVEVRKLQQVRLIGKGQGCRFLSTVLETSKEPDSDGSRDAEEEDLTSSTSSDETVMIVATMETQLENPEQEEEVSTVDSQFDHHSRLFELVNHFWCRCKDRRRGIGGGGSGMGSQDALVRCWTFGASIHNAHLSRPVATLVSDGSSGIREARSQARSGLGFVECSGIAADHGRYLVVSTLCTRWLSAIDCRVSRNGRHSDGVNVECGCGSCAWFSSIDKCTVKTIGGSGPQRIYGGRWSGCSRSRL